MSGLKIPEYKVSVDLLRPGVFIKLEKIAWYKHPFLFNSFKIKNMDQVQTLRDMGINEVICVPEKSDRLPLQAKPKSKGAEERPKKEKEEPSKESGALKRQWEIKKERTERLKKKKQRIAECEQKYESSIESVSNMMQGLAGGNVDSMVQANEFVSELSKFFLDDVDSTLHLMNVSATEETVYFHSMNVAVLSLVLGKEAKLAPEQMKTLGLGALFHDIGKSKIEKKLLRKPGRLTKPELQLIMMHPRYGVEILAKANEGGAEVAKEVVQMVYSHHERLDGKGYPKQLPAEHIGKLTRILSIINAYDNHINRVTPEDSLTPYQALSFMYAKQKAMFDQQLLALFIRCMGIYPPGTIVQLNTGTIGMVISVNAKNPLAPSIVIYDPEVPKKEALIVEMEEEPDLKVEKSLKPSQLPPQIFDYLSPRTRVCYYVDPGGDGEK